MKMYTSMPPAMWRWARGQVAFGKVHLGFGPCRLWQDQKNVSIWHQISLQSAWKAISVACRSQRCLECNIWDSSMSHQMIEVTIWGYKSCLSRAASTTTLLLVTVGGRKELLKLTTANIDSFMNGINLNDLPTAFPDAITITRRLSCRYLWIDSLCIIQDSEDDWEHQASQMAEIYQHSCCTVAALDREDGSDGCIVYRNPLAVRYLVFTADKTSWCITRANRDEMEEFFSNGGPDRLIKNLNPDIDPARRFYTTPNETKKWNIDLLYFWVVQERLLPTTILAYSSESMVWKFRECSASERIPTGWDSSENSGPLQDILSNENYSCGKVPKVISANLEMPRFFFTKINPLTFCSCATSTGKYIDYPTRKHFKVHRRVAQTCWGIYLLFIDPSDRQVTCNWRAYQPDPDARQGRSNIRTLGFKLRGWADVVLQTPCGGRGKTVQLRTKPVMDFAECPCAVVRCWYWLWAVMAIKGS